MKTVVFVDELLLVNFAAAAAAVRGQRGGCGKHPCPAGAAVACPAGDTI